MDIYWNIFTMHGPVNVKFTNTTSKWQMEFNSAFKGLSSSITALAAWWILGMWIQMALRNGGSLKHVWNRREKTVTTEKNPPPFSRIGLNISRKVIRNLGLAPVCTMTNIRLTYVAGNFFIWSTTLSVSMRAHFSRRDICIKRQDRHMFHVSIDATERPNITLKYTQTFTE
jgi:hypothetical protein